MFQRLVFIVVSVALLSLTGCKNRTMSADFSASTVGYQPGHAYHLNSGDRVRIDVFDQPGLSRIYSIDGSGSLNMPLIGRVRARGMTTYSLAKRIRTQLRRKYIKDPEVSIEISQYRPFYILGEVRNAGQFPYVDGMTVQAAVAIAGGYTPRANERKFKIYRHIDGQLTSSYVTNDYHLRPGDTVKVVERLF